MNARLVGGHAAVRHVQSGSGADNLHWPHRRHLLDGFHRLVYQLIGIHMELVARGLPYAVPEGLERWIERHIFLQLDFHFLFLVADLQFFSLVQDDVAHLLLYILHFGDIFGKGDFPFLRRSLEFCLDSALLLAVGFHEPLLLKGFIDLLGTLVAEFLFCPIRLFEQDVGEALRRQHAEAIATVFELLLEAVREVLVAFVADYGEHVDVRVEAAFAFLIYRQT